MLGGEISIISDPSHLFHIVIRLHFTVAEFGFWHLYAKCNVEMCTKILLIYRLYFFKGSLTLGDKEIFLLIKRR